MDEVLRFSHYHSVHSKTMISEVDRFSPLYIYPSFSISSVLFSLSLSLSVICCCLFFWSFHIDVNYRQKRIKSLIRRKLFLFIDFETIDKMIRLEEIDENDVYHLHKNKWEKWYFHTYESIDLLFLKYIHIYNVYAGAHFNEFQSLVHSSLKSKYQTFSSVVIQLSTYWPCRKQKRKNNKTSMFDLWPETEILSMLSIFKNKVTDFNHVHLVLFIWSIRQTKNGNYLD